MLRKLPVTLLPLAGVIFAVTVALPAPAPAAETTAGGQLRHFIECLGWRLGDPTQHASNCGASHQASGPAASLMVSPAGTGVGVALRPRPTGTPPSGESATASMTTGIFNSGTDNTGIGNSGTANTGLFNTGNVNTGFGNSGTANTGLFNSGTANTGFFSQ